MKKKKVLIFIDWYLPGYRAGGPVRSCANMISHMIDEYDFFVITRNQDYASTTAYKDVPFDQWVTRNPGIRVFYSSKARVTFRSFMRLVSEVDPDVVYLNGLYSLKFTLLPLVVLKWMKVGRIVLAVRGMLAPGALSIKANKKKVFLSLARAMNLFRNITFQATTPEEVMQIRGAFGDKYKIVLAENFPRVGALEELQPLPKTAGELRVVNVARIAPEKNLSFALEVLQLATCRITFDFYGPVYNLEYFKKCEYLLSKLPPNVTATYKGVAESDELATILSDYHLMFMPTLGENFGHVIVEALQAGVPVLISNRTPWRDLQLSRAGADIALGDVIPFAEQLNTFCSMGEKEFNAWRAGAREYALSRMNLPLLRKRYLHLFEGQPESDS